MTRDMGGRFRTHCVNAANRSARRRPGGIRPLSLNAPGPCVLPLLHNGAHLGVLPRAAGPHVGAPGSGDIQQRAELPAEAARPAIGHHPLDHNLESSKEGRSAVPNTSPSFRLAAARVDDTVRSRPATCRQMHPTPESGRERPNSPQILRPLLIRDPHHLLGIHVNQPWSSRARIAQGQRSRAPGSRR